MAEYISSPITGDSLAAQAPNAVKKLWDIGVETFEQTTDFFKEFEGPGSSMPIQSRSDMSKGRGQLIEFPVKSGLYAEPHLGDELFTDGDHYEGLKVGSNSLAVDFVRHGVRYTERTEEAMGMRGELVDGLPEELGKWLGRYKTDQMFMMFKHKGDPTRNYKIMGNRSSVNKITSTDTLSYEAILECGSMLQRQNGRACYVGKDSSGNPIYKYIAVSTSDALFSLQKDSDYKTASIDAGVRGPENLIFKGGFHNIRGNIIREYTSLDHDGEGPIGSAINPKAELGVAIEAGTAAFNIYGGGYAEAAALTRTLFFKSFPNFAYRFLYGDTLTVGSDPFYVAIINPDGKFGFYKCTTNDGSKIRATERLAAADDTAAKTQVGNVVWNADKNTDEHEEGAIILLCSENGVPIGSTIFMGATAARRGYGKFARRRTQQEHEGGFVRDVYIQSVFGQAPRRDRRNRAPGFVVIHHAIHYPGLTLSPSLAS